ncbi:NADH:flavin oxidoreductase [Streptomyces sp. CSDS2]|uniref:NADH:flavin oxidoreductase n=1 Tax=Streptomyces sp. CSDS2 TaxID=3055051 RepID=UPI0025B15F43|nr:NADH:flavin oxidoreductase [Streptomyces sp. CSDS2]MDN3263505.1 NADH:flavin oxidoreductase [Streptomyces sp. CSDS2]
MPDHRLAADAVRPLFEPFTLGELTLDNRFVMAPMTRSASPGGVPGPDVAEYYARRAAGGTGLIITEGTVVDHPAAANGPGLPRFHGEDALAGWRRVVEEVHRAGGRIFPQLWHVGADRFGDAVPEPHHPPVSPSGLLNPGQANGDPLTTAQIDSLVGSFARAAADARRLGFDGIELHGGHGHLIDQFLWSGSNVRTDGYGGGIRERARFAAEVIAACRQATGPGFSILIRLSQWKTTDFSARLAATPQEWEELLAPLVEAGVDGFHCSTRRFWLPEFDGPALSLAGWTKKVTGLPTVTVGSVGLDNSEFQTAFLEGKGAANAPLDRLVELFEAGEFDLVAVGRALLADPEWVAKVRAGRTDELIPFDVSALATLR